MDNEAELIRHQMEETRSALQDKVERLERQLEEKIDTVRDTFDVRRQVERHPWTMFCGAAAVGFLGARLVEGIRVVPPSIPANAAPLPASAIPWTRPARPPGWLDALADKYHDEWSKVKDVALSTLGGLIGEAITEAAPPALKKRIKEVVDDMTVKLGGHPLNEPLFSSAPKPAEASGKDNGMHREEMSSPLGGKRRDWGDGADRFDS